MFREIRTTEKIREEKKELEGFRNIKAEKMTKAEVDSFWEIEFQKNRLMAEVRDIFAAEAKAQGV